MLPVRMTVLTKSSTRDDENRTLMEHLNTLNEISRIQDILMNVCRGLSW